MSDSGRYIGQEREGSVDPKTGLARSHAEPQGNCPDCGGTGGYTPGYVANGEIVGPDACATCSGTGDVARLAPASVEDVQAACWRSFKTMCEERGFTGQYPGGIVRWAQDKIDALTAATQAREAAEERVRGLEKWVMETSLKHDSACLYWCGKFLEQIRAALAQPGGAQ